MADETDMATIYDMVSKSTAVSFRGKHIYLPGPYLERKAAIAAGEERCRKLGWLDLWELERDALFRSESPITHVFVRTILRGYSLLPGFLPVGGGCLYSVLAHRKAVPDVSHIGPADHSRDEAVAEL